jgi:HSP20 family protein
MIDRHDHKKTHEHDDRQDAGHCEEKKDDYHLMERSYGGFQRSFRVPDTIDADKAKASFEKGVLKVAIPKRAEAVKAEKRIPIGKS